VGSHSTHRTHRITDFSPCAAAIPVRVHHRHFIRAATLRFVLLHLLLRRLL
jgi:hypothetical protein